MANLWRQLTDLLPQSPRQIGQVMDIHSDDSLTIELLGGGLLRVRGRADVGESVFVRDGLVEGVAPSLPLVEIEI